MRFLILWIIALLGFSAPSFAGQIISYKDGDTILEAYVARPEKVEGPLPVVMIIHQWMGLTDNEKMRADMLAKQGYMAVAIDMYGKGVRPKNQEEAGKLAGKYKSDTKLALQRMNAALSFIQTLPGQNRKIVVIGYCFGGTMALELARTGIPLSGVISFHGALATKHPAARGAIKEPLQVHHGADDPMVPPAEVAAFKEEMKKADANMKFYAYPGAVHAFTQKEVGNDKASGAAYNEAADKESWARATEFLAKTLK